MSDAPSITCPRCGMTSHNRHDIAYQYCGNCHTFHNDMRGERGEFSVAVFYDDGTHAYVERWLIARLAVKQARIVIDLVAPNVDRVIITDGGDNTVFQWERGLGVIFPPTQE